MKTKSNIKWLKGATIARIHDGDKHGDFDAETFALQSLEDLQEMGSKVEFLKSTGTGKRAKVESLGVVILAKTGDVESLTSSIIADATRVDANLKGTQSPNPFVTDTDIPDELTATKDSCAWNLHGHEVESIALRDDSNVLNRFEYVQTPLVTSKGKGTGFDICECSDNGKPVGKPFAPSYGLVTNDKFISLIEAFASVLDKLGVKYSVVTTGTIMSRERQFVTLKIEQADTLKLGKREFKQFLSFLNSIASNAGCTLTVNNTSFCVCCRNTFAHCLLDVDGSPFYFGAKHTSKIGDYIKDLPRVFESFMASNDAMFGVFTRFNEFGMSMEQAEAMFASLVTRDENKGELDDKAKLSTRSANIAERLKELFTRGDGNDGQTALDVFSSVTQYYTHESAGETEDKTKQFESSEIGSGAKAKRTMFSWLCQVMQGGDIGKARFGAILKLGDKLWIDYRQAKASK